MMGQELLDVRGVAPPENWGVVVHQDAIDSLADEWAGSVFGLPTFDYPGTPEFRDEAWWFDYAVLAVSVLACLWPPEGDETWHVEHDGVWLDDAQGVFAAFTRQLRPTGLDLEWFSNLSQAQGQALFAGRGTLQLIDERTALLKKVATTLGNRWQGSALNLVDAAGRDGVEIVRLLTETVPGFRDRPETLAGVAPFDKLSHLCAAIMAAGVGWTQAGFRGFEGFPVYPDYMLPRVFRHFGLMSYRSDIADLIDGRQHIAKDSTTEHGIRWATIFCGQRLSDALAERDTKVSGPALDYRLWSIAVLGPQAASFGEHHRTVTMSY